MLKGLLAAQALDAAHPSTIQGVRLHRDRPMLEETGIQWAWQRGVLRDTSRWRISEIRCAGACPSARGVLSGSMSIECEVILSPGYLAIK